MNREELAKYIEKELGDWGNNVSLMLQENIRKNKLVISEQLVRSFEYQVRSEMSTKIQSLLIGFNDYGRMKEMRSLVFTKMPPVESIESYVEKIGVSKFKYVPGYKRGNIPSESIAKKRIAWGIARSKFSDYKGKPKKWFAKAFYREINHLITNLMIGYQEAAAGTIVNNLKL